METEADGREAATSPGTDAWTPQKLKEAGRSLPWSLCRELSPGTPWPPFCVSALSSRVNFEETPHSYFLLQGPCRESTYGFLSNMYLFGCPGSQLWPVESSLLGGA